MNKYNFICPFFQDKIYTGILFFFLYELMNIFIIHNYGNNSNFFLSGGDMIDRITELLGDEARYLLDYKCTAIKKEQLHLPGSDFIERTLIPSDRPVNVLRNLRTVFDHGRLTGTGYVSILPVDQGIEHSAGASFAPNPLYFDPENIVKLAIEGGCNAVASTPPDSTFPADGITGL